MVRVLKIEMNDAEERRDSCHPEDAGPIRNSIRSDPEIEGEVFAAFDQRDRSHHMAGK